jgi:hypothetical protein
MEQSCPCASQPVRQHSRAMRVEDFDFGLSIPDSKSVDHEAILDVVDG